jgi:O-antigen ligase
MNTQTHTISKYLRISIIISICLTLVTPLIVSSSLYFPFITGKAFFMRSFILLAGLLYVMLATIDKAYRPRVSVLMYNVIGFMIILAASWMNSVAPDRSFWSNFERMEGFVTLLYMAVLFVVAASTIKKREWTWVMHVSLALSVIVGIVATRDFDKVDPGTVARLSGTLGNSSYLGVYALIHIFFAILSILMIYRGKREEVLLTSGDHGNTPKITSASYIYMSIYGLLALFNLYILFYTGTRGSFVGLVAGLLLTSGYLAWKERNKVLRYGSIGVLVSVFVIVVLLGSFKNTEFVKSYAPLSRFASLITTDIKGVFANQGEARTILWRMAYEGVQEKPLLGWGQDTFGYVFAKHYDPGMYAQEQWFDRSHNVFLDWLISAGVLGLLGYLSLFVCAFICIFSRKTRFTIIEKSVLIGLLAAYFIHNIFVFDNLSSYILFFLLLAYIHDRYTHDKHVEHVSRKSTSEVDLQTLLIASGFFGILIASYVGYKTIYQPYAQNRLLIEAMMLAEDQTKVTTEMLPRMKKVPMDVVYANFEKIFTLGQTGQSEAYEQLATIALQAIPSTTVSEKTKIDFIQLYQSRISLYENAEVQDPRYLYFATNFYDKLGATDKAIEYAQKAYVLSPEKQSFAYNLAILTLKKNNIPQALVYLKKAYEDAPKNQDAFAYYVSVLLEDAKINNGASYNAVKLGGVAQVLADGYTKYGHTLILDSNLWDLFTKTGKKKEGQLLATRIIELVPTKQAEIKKLVQ